MSDTTKTLGVVVAIAVVLVAAIVGVVRLTMDDLLTEEELRDAVAHQTGDIAEASGDEKKKKIKRLSRTLSKRKDGGRLDGETNDKLRETFTQLDSDEQAYWIRVMIPERFEEWTKKFYEDHPDPEERKEKIEEIVTVLQLQFDSQPDDKLKEMRAGMETKQGKAYLASVQTYFTNKLDSTQRSEMQPVFREVLRQVDRLIRLPRPTKAEVKAREEAIRAGKVGPPEGEKEVGRATKKPVKGK